jgi:pilus assembly protein TadC
MTLVVALSALVAVALWPGRHAPVRWPARPPRDQTGRCGPWVERARHWSPGSRRSPSIPVEQVADALVLLVLALRSGLAMTEALRRVADGSDGPVGADLRAVVAALEWGVSAEQAWGYAGEAWRPAAVSFQMSATTGASPTSLLAETVVRCRAQLQEERTRRAAWAGVMLVLPLGLGFLPAFAFTAVVPVVLALSAGVLSGR